MPCRPLPPQANVLLVGSEIETLVCGKLSFSLTHFPAITLRHFGTSPTLLKGLRVPPIEDRATVLSIGTTRVLGKLGVLDALTNKCTTAIFHFLNERCCYNPTHTNGPSRQRMGKDQLQRACCPARVPSSRHS